jgi:hypothetical protein
MQRRNMMRKHFLMVLGILILISLACSLTPNNETNEQNNSNDTDAAATSVAATVAASNAEQDQEEQPEQQAEQPAPTQTQDQSNQPGTIEGNVCYPSDHIPEMTVFLHNILTDTSVEVPIPLNVGNFSQQVPPGEYKAYAWLPDFSGGGSYSQAVPCGLSVNCNDHSLIEFVVAPGATVSGVEICDWYGGPNSIPLPPGMDISQITGSITGTLGYPAEYIPAMEIVAFNTNTTFWYYVTTPEGANSYTITGLPPGPYRVVAYTVDGGLPGGYSQAVPCGLSVNCNDHSLITVNVTAGGTVTGVDPIDFYAQPGDFPPNPVP